jgi:hypothetical protein
MSNSPAEYTSPLVSQAAEILVGCDHRGFHSRLRKGQRRSAAANKNHIPTPMRVDAEVRPYVPVGIRPCCHHCHSHVRTTGRTCPSPTDNWPSQHGRGCGGNVGAALRGRPPSIDDTPKVGTRIRGHDNNASSCGRTRRSAPTFRLGFVLTAIIAILTSALRERHASPLQVVRSVAPQRAVSLNCDSLASSPSTRDSRLDNSSAAHQGASTPRIRLR